MNLKSIVAAALMAASAIGIAGGDALAQTKQVRVLHPPTSDMWPFFIAKKEGLFEKRGLDVKLELTTNTATVPAAIISGSTDIGFVTPSTLLPAIENGLDLVTVVGNVITDENYDSSFVTKPDTTIKTPKDIEGRKVGLPGIGAFLHVLFDEWMISKGADPKKVTFVEVPFVQMFDALRAGSVDAVIPVEPFISRIVGSKSGVVTFPYLAELTKTQKYRVLVGATTRDYAGKNADMIKSLRAALEEASAMHAKDPEKTREIVGEFIKMPPQALAALKFPGAPVAIADKELSDWVVLLKKRGDLTKDLDPSKFNIK